MDAPETLNLKVESAAPGPVPVWIDQIARGRQPWRTSLRWTLGISFALHLTLSPALFHKPAVSKEELDRYETEYQKRTEAVRVARFMAREISDRIIMPPPPPDPEDVVSETLTNSLTSDLTQLTDGLMDVTLQKEMVSHVAASLKDELAEASQNIAEGKLSEDEIKELHKKFKKRAHEESVVWREQMRESNQVENTTMTVTEWYENKVSRALRAQMEGWNLDQSWKQFRSSSLFAVDLHGFTLKVDTLGALSEGKTNKRFGLFGGKALGGHWHQLPGWPEPHADQPSAIKATLKNVLGNQGQTSSWQKSIEGYLGDFYPHRKAEMEARIKASITQGEKCIAAVNDYESALSSGSAEEKKQALKVCLTELKALHENVNPLVVRGRSWQGNTKAGQYHIIAKCLRSRLLRRKDGKMAYKRYIAKLLAGLELVVVKLARNQFREGIIVREKGLKEAMKDFKSQIGALLHRDLLQIHSQKRFNARLFTSSSWNPYRHPVSGARSVPSEADIENDEKAMAAQLEKWPEADRPFAEFFPEVLTERLMVGVDRMVQDLVNRVAPNKRLDRRIFAKAGSADHSDKVTEKLDARKRAMEGRGQDLANLTPDGVPDTSAPLIALMHGASKGHGANLQPVVTTMVPKHVTSYRSAQVWRSAPPIYPPHATKWGFEEQAVVKPKFKTRRYEAIPFLPKFPKLDGDLSDWGKVRPLLLNVSKRNNGPKEGVLVYMAWNYQGFFFGYHVDHPEHMFHYPREPWYDSRRGVQTRDPYEKPLIKNPNHRWIHQWSFAGDSFRLFFDTLDARNKNAGEPHVQEFVIFPRGTQCFPDMPGIERIIASQKMAQPKKNVYGYVVSGWKLFPKQPAIENGPDGTGPYRVTRMSKTGYDVEVFLPRSCFEFPVMAPGWHMGFDCSVAFGEQHHRHYGRFWALEKNGTSNSNSGNQPDRWGDILLLGTDPRVIIQDADPKGTRTQAVIPGHSYLVTVIDPDRNVNLTQVDTVLVSAEVGSHNGQQGGGDVEVFILKETGKNSSVFRGYVNTQPGFGRAFQGVIEVIAGQQVRFGYVDFANARGQRNVVYELKLPVASSFIRSSVGR